LHFNKILFTSVGILMLCAASGVQASCPAEVRPGEESGPVYRHVASVSAKGVGGTQEWKVRRIQVKTKDGVKDGEFADLIQIPEAPIGITRSLSDPARSQISYSPSRRSSDMEETIDERLIRLQLSEYNGLSAQAKALKDKNYQKLEKMFKEPPPSPV